MKHLIICREYPPAPSGGIGTYVVHISNLLAEAGETVHIIGQLWKGAERETEEKCQGRLIIHRLPLEDWSVGGGGPNPLLKTGELRGLFNSGFHPQCFSWQASLLAERLVQQEGIDLVEAQEYEAPLYYFQIRRALGFGPRKEPPCLVHLHSPTPLVGLHNGWSHGTPWVLNARRLEHHTVMAADGLLCPSHFHAREAEEMYRLPQGSVHVIPLPLGESLDLERSRAIWQQGAVCYVGRLERRKGVIEWLQAAVSALRDRPEITFQLIGANALGTRQMNGAQILDHLIPRDLRDKFLFAGPLDRSALPKRLASARIGVVPSRWENFPNTCIELMNSGVPVIATRAGGMVEMIRDGETGWLANACNPQALKDALLRALDTPPETLADMGAQASLSIRKLCDNRETLHRHLVFREQLMKRGTGRSRLLTGRSPGGPGAAARTCDVKDSVAPPRGLAVVVSDADQGGRREQCLRDMSRQTSKPVAVALIEKESRDKMVSDPRGKDGIKGWLRIERGTHSLASAKNLAVREIVKSGINPLGLVFVREGDRLETRFLERCESTFRCHPEVGIVSCWAIENGMEQKVRIRPCPSFPFQWFSNDALPFSALRFEAFQMAGGFRPEIIDGFDEWDLFNGIMVQGWAVVTIPEVLGSCSGVESWWDAASDPHRQAMRQRLFERMPEQGLPETRELILLAESISTQNGLREVSRAREDLAWAFGEKTEVRLRRLLLRRFKSSLHRHLPDRAYQGLRRMKHCMSSWTWIEKYR